MNTTTYHAAGTRSAPPPYLANLARAARGLLKALFSVHTTRPPVKIYDRTEVLRVAREYRDTAPGLSQELGMIACRDE